MFHLGLLWVQFYSLALVAYLYHYLWMLSHLLIILLDRLIVSRGQILHLQVKLAYPLGSHIVKPSPAPRSNQSMLELVPRLFLFCSFPKFKTLIIHVASKMSNGKERLKLSALDKFLYQEHQYFHFIF